MVTWPSISCNSTSAPRPFRSTGPLTPMARMMSLLRSIDLHFAADVLQAHAGVVGDDLDVAVDVGDIEVAVAAVRFNGGALGHRDFHFVGDALVAGDVILIGADGQFVGVAGDLERRILIGAVGAALLQAANGCGR